MQTVTIPAEELPFRIRTMFGGALVRSLIEAAANVTGVDSAEISGPRRHRELAYIRFAIMTAAREQGRPLSIIGRALGGRDHTSVLNGLAKAKELEASDADFNMLLTYLRSVADQGKVVVRIG